MGELGPSFLRKAPGGWLPARVFVEAHSLRQGEEHTTGVYHDERASSLSAVLDADLRVEVPGRDPVRFHDRRVVPQWLLDVGAPSGKRWYQVRLKPQSGMVARIGFPCVADPSDPTKIWIDWDAAYDEHVEAWESEAAIKKEMAKRRGGIEGTLDRVLSNPFTRDVTEEEAATIDDRIAAEDARNEEIRQQYVQQDPNAAFQPASAGDAAELERRRLEAEWIFNTGREVTATVTANAPNGQAIAGIPVFAIAFDLHEDPPRSVALEYCWGHRGAKKYKVGKTYRVRVDPEDPDRITPAE